MSTRLPAPPPTLRGYDYLRLLGSGGFADVYLYQQHAPKRQVAVKVLLEDALNEGVHGQFEAEADLMAQVSSHPSIVSILSTDIASDGRPYLVMEYCSRPNLSVRYRSERIAVAEALRIGVRLAGAVETAHRNGILHRDIKPANVLTTEYGWPALTDFGISVATGPDVAAEAVGMSIPWSPPELFQDPPTSDVRSDVWSLGATIYTLLARRSPFELQAGRNDPVSLMARIETTPLPTTGRSDAPASLEQVLARSMAKTSGARYDSALELARALQQVELELQLGMTQIDVLDAQVHHVEGDEDSTDDGLTRVRGVRAIDPSADQTSSPAVTRPAAPLVAPLAPAAASLALEATFLRGAASPEATPFELPAPAMSDTVHRIPATSLDSPDVTAPSTSSRRVLVATAVALLVVVALAGFLLRGGAGADNLPPENSRPAAAQELSGALLASVPQVADLVGVPSGSGTSFSWSSPEPLEGDSYVWRRVDPTAETAPAVVTRPEVVVEAAGRVCIEVLLRRANGRSSVKPAVACGP